MTNTSNRALVLLGYSGTGKDTLANLAITRYGDSVGNCKFGEFNKRIAALALNVPPSYFEDKHWRQTHDVLATEFDLDTSYHLSPFDLLSVLFVGGNSNTPVGEHWRACYQSYTITKAKQNYMLPIFTDVRSQSELMKVKGNFDTCVVYLDCPWIPEGTNDTNVTDMVTSNSVWFLKRERDESAVVTFMRLLEITNDHWN